MKGFYQENKKTTYKTGKIVNHVPDKEWYPECINNSYNSTTNQTAWLKNG